MPLGILRDVELLVKYRQQFINDDSSVFIVEGVVLGWPVRVTVAPITGSRFGLVRSAARIDEYSNYHGNFAAVDQVVHHHLRANVSLRRFKGLPVVVNHQTGG